jgi:hypothetical protein
VFQESQQKGMLNPFICLLPQAKEKSMFIYIYISRIILLAIFILQDFHNFQENG